MEDKMSKILKDLKNLNLEEIREKLKNIQHALDKKADEVDTNNQINQIDE